MHPRKLYLNSVENLRLRLGKTPYDVSDAIAIYGSPRAGTTWLLELLSNLPRYITLFEPLHKDWYPDSMMYGFTPRPYLSPDSENDLYKRYLKYVFEGLVTDKYPKFEMIESWNRLIGDRMLVKFIRANRLLPWILNNFKLKANILIIRHPCSTISSQIKTGITGYNIKKRCIPHKVILKLETILNEAQDIVDDDILKELKKIKSGVGILAATWALDQYVPLIHKKKLDFTIVNYESLVLNPNEEIANILKITGYEDLHNKIISNINKPSKTSKNLKRSKEKQLSKWVSFLSKKQVKEIFDVINLFGIDFYDHNIEPDNEKIKKWNK